MKHLSTFLTLCLLLACNASKPLATPGPKKEEPKEGMVSSKKVPATIKGFRFVESVNAYFRNDVSKSVQKRIVNQLKKGDQPSNKSGRYTKKAEPQTIKEPFWADYFGEEQISGGINFNIRVGKDGQPDVIVVIDGIRNDVDRIAVQLLSESLFSPAIHAKSKKPSRSWVKLNKTYN